MDDLLTARQLQDLFKIHRTTLYRMLDDGRLIGVKIGGQWRFARSEVEAVISGARATEAKPAPASTQVLPLHCIQPIQDVFAEIAGIAAVTTTPDGEPLTELSNACQFCSLMLSSPTGRRACIASWRRLGEPPEKRTPLFTCHAGLQYARARIEVNRQPTAMLIAGQFYGTAPDSAEESGRVERLAEQHGIDPAALDKAARDIPRLDDSKRARLGGWLETVAHTFEDIGRERAELMGRLGRIAEMSRLAPE